MFHPRITIPALVLLSNMSSPAQSPNPAEYGTLQGIVRYESDPTTGVAGVAVTIERPPWRRVTTTDARGEFRMHLLKPGKWKVTAKGSNDSNMNGPNWTLVHPKKLRAVQIEAGKTTHLEILGKEEPGCAYPVFTHQPIDFNRQGTGLKLDGEDWKGLPIR